MNHSIPVIANKLMDKSVLYSCSLKEAWEKHMHPSITEQATFEEVKSFIDERIEQSKQAIYHSY